MFDFVSSYLSPGESWTDDHHYGVQVINHTSAMALCTLTLAGATVHLSLFAEQHVTLTDDPSQPIRVTNTGAVPLQVEWQKSRD